MQPATNNQAATTTSLSLAQVVTEMRTITGTFDALLAQVEQVVSQPNWLPNLIAENTPAVDFPASDFVVGLNSDGLQQVTIQENRIKDILASLGVSTGGGTPPANNLFSSTDLSNAAAWAFSDLVVPIGTGQPNATNSPTAYLLKPNAQTNDNHSFHNVVRVPVEENKPYRVAFRMKGAGVKKVSLLLLNTSNNLLGTPVIFDLQTQAQVGTGGGASVVALANGWAEYRVEFTPGSATDVAVFVKLWADAVDANYAGDNTIGVYVENPSFVKL